MRMALVTLPAVALLAATVPGPTPPGDSGPGGSGPPGSGAPGTGAPEMPAPPLPPGAEVVAEGLDNPRGILLGPDGAIWVAEAGGVPEPDAAPCLPGPEGPEVCYNTTGAITRIADGAQERVVTGLRSIGERDGMRASGPHDLAVTADGTVFVLFGLGADPETRAENEGDGPHQLGRLFTLDPDSGELTEFADVAGYEAVENPDGGLLDSNPYAMIALDDGSLAIADAGANALLAVAADGTISTLAVFPDTMGEGPDGGEFSMNAVPDGLAVGPAGEFYVGQLTGFPFPVDGANVFTVPAGGGEPEVVAEGFTNVIDVALGPDGSLYVLEINSGGMLNIDPGDPSTLTGALIRVGDDGSQEIVADGLVMPTSMAIAEDGTIYVTNVGVVAGGGQVLRLTPDAG